MGWYLDGKVTAVVGTHTHVPTADARVLPGGTAYITDVGMTGARGGVIGVRKEQSIAVMRTHMPQRYDAAEDDPWLMAVLIRASVPRRADAIEPVALEERQPGERREPDEVEVEPVVDAELGGDQHRGGERAAVWRSRSRGTNATATASATAPAWTSACSSGVVRPRSRTASRGRPGTRSCAPTASPGRTGRATTRPRASPRTRSAPRAGAPTSSGASASGASLARPASAASAPRAAGAARRAGRASPAAAPARRSRPKPTRAA